MQYEIGRVSLLGNRENNQDRLGVSESHAGIMLPMVWAVNQEARSQQKPW